MKKAFQLSLTVLALCLTTTASSDAAMLIDNFDQPTQIAGSTVVIGLPAFASGADRTLTSPLGGAFSSNSGTFPGILAATRFAPGGPDDFNVTYDNFGGVGASLDFTGGGSNIGIILGGVGYFHGSPSALLTLSVTVDDGSGPVSHDIILAPSGAAVDIFVPFSAFAGVDFGTIETLTLDSTLPASGGGFTSFGLDSIAVGTPEPSSFILCGIGLAAAGAYRIRRRRQATKA